MKKPDVLKTTFSLYKVHKSIGEGGSGIVYDAEDENSQEFAIKILAPNKATREKLKRFQNEYRFCSRNTHPNIIKVLDRGLTEDQAPFFVMPLYQYSLRPVIGDLAPNVVLDLFLKILDGVEAAHMRGVVHRDLKPENILLRNEERELVITDFGIARFEEEDLYTAVETKDGTRLANFNYAAPEQKERNMEVDHRADIYALGLVLNEMYTGRLALGTNYKTITSVTEDFSYLDALVTKMLEQNADARFNNIDEIKKELIAAGRVHVTRQKVSELQSAVIPNTELDDPIINDPMQIVDFDWENNRLSMFLNHAPTPAWIESFLSMGGYRTIIGKEPNRFDFSGKVASISASANEVQDIVDIFRGWLPKATEVYKKRCAKELAATEEKMRRQLEARKRKEEEREHVLSTTKL